MSRPWLRPEDGKFYLRKKTPRRYLAVAGRAEFRIPLRTRDPKEAKQRMGEALATWEAMVAGWERALNREALTPERAKEIAARWAASIAGGAHLDMGGEDSDVFEPLSLPECRTPERVARMWDRVEFHAEEALKLVNISITPETRPVLLNEMIPAVQAAYLQADLARVGVDGASPAVQPLSQLRASLPLVPEPPPPERTAPTPAFTFDALWETWKAVTKAGPRTVHETRGMLRQLAAFLGHDDAVRVTKADIIRWRDQLKAEGLNNNTWNNRVSLVGRVFKQAVKDEKLPVDPTEGTRLEKTPNVSWRPYTDEEAALILRAARKETKPSLRWAHWIMALSGMRVGEVLQLTGGDIQKDPASGIWLIKVAPDPTLGKSVKTGVTRHVPVHPALVAEGFLAFAALAAPDAPLFPEKGLDRYGRRGGRAWNLVGTWVRDTVGITDRKTAPNHSWRHRMEDELRAAEVPEDARDAIVGHTRRTTGRVYGVRGEALSRLCRELSKVKPPPGL